MRQQALDWILAAARRRTRRWNRNSTSPTTSAARRRRCATCTATTRSSGTTGSPAPGSTRWSATICASRACCATRRSSSATPTSPYIPLHRTSRYGRSATKSAQTFWVALTPSRNDNGGMFYYPDDRTIFPHEFDLAYPMFKCIDLQANGISARATGGCRAGRQRRPGLARPHRTWQPHNNRSGELRIGMPIVFVEDDEFHQLNRGRQHENLDRFPPESVFPDEAITEDNLDHYLPQLCDYSLKMVTFLARSPASSAMRRRSTTSSREPRLATLSASDAGRDDDRVIDCTLREGCQARRCGFDSARSVPAGTEIAGAGGWI